MNLHSIVSPYVGAVNPNVPALIRVSVGQGPTLPNGTRQPMYATPGTLTGSIAGNVLTVSAVQKGVLQPGQILAGAGISPNVMVLQQLDGTLGGPGDYALTQPQTFASGPITTSLTLFGQVQPLSTSDLKQIEGLNLGGIKKSMYVNGDLNSVVRIALKGGDLVTLPDGTTWLVATQVEGWNMTAGWTKVVMVLQNGA